MKTNSNRLLALDVLRGITIAGMILVNNPGSWQYVYEPLRHAQWNGLTPTDLVFPFFMFIMGISTYISLRKYNFSLTKDSVGKIAKRTIVIFVLGMALSWLGLMLRQGFWSFENLRIMGVLGRLGLCYGIVSLIACSVKHRYIPYIIAGILGVYLIILYAGNGFAYDQTSILSIVDRAVLGLNHMYNDNGIDPEGILSTIPAVAHVLIGFWCGKLIMNLDNIHEKIEQLFIVGVSLAFVGYLLSYACPINKKIWSPSFVLVTCGMASSLQALLLWIIDVKGRKKWSRPFEVFGVNPLFIYVLAGVLATFGGSAQGFVYKEVLQPVFGNYLASLVYALLFVTLNWAVGYNLYKKKIYIKI
ncbi:acyltransferase family protein [Bacteroides sp. 519]|uniref:acyltransferase family protein n=1 Tax=Bacteroides sp. 519 TaxID=2302937 RepID=UPI0013D20049|nr:heparan-alpha-glucosaminide N-acetyltransferase domain-containing protein [Bacteroides sp. 519]NDV57383.1 DUF1624 domain-containing protein [Bacteroides sp. 519]